MSPASSQALASAPEAAECSTIEVAHWLGLAVRSVQLMVDRGELQAWKTPGGHRRIARASVEQWLRQHGAAQGSAAAAAAPTLASAAAAPTGRRGVGTRRRPPAAAPLRPCVLLIEDSRHFQNLVSLLVRQRFPQVDLRVADDGIAGLLMAGQLQPDVLLVDILLPGIDGATLITSLRSHPAFGGCQLIVITSMEGAALDPYRFALHEVPVVHKPQLVAELPALLAAALAARTEGAGRPEAVPVRAQPA
jgi:excisionase family DNA binding protein